MEENRNGKGCGGFTLIGSAMAFSTIARLVMGASIMPRA